MTILLPQVLAVPHPDKFKLHLACWNGKEQPLDVFVRDRTQWDGWNRWRSVRDDFSRDYIFSLIDFYPEKDTWLFGGAYKVLGRKPVDNAPSYEIEPLADNSALVGRLKVRLKRPGRAKAFNFENHYERIVVSEITPRPYAGESFPGYEQIDVPFPMLELILSIERPDWKAALENVKGVYLITDVGNGKRYVGSAYGGTGIWSRWRCYVQTGHGYNDELTRLIKTAGIEYARHHFRFTLLEYRSMRTDDNEIIRREQFWKSVLLTRGEHGYNQN